MVNQKSQGLLDLILGCCFWYTWLTYISLLHHMIHSGSCHCGAIRFEVEGTIETAMECNCSHCSRKGFLLWFVPKTQFTLQTPDAPLTSYTFNKHVINHLFCPTCGVQAFAYGADPEGNEVAAINIRCIEDIDLSTIPKVPFDGKNM